MHTGTERPGITFELYAPAASLSPFVRAYTELVHPGAAGEPSAQLVLPDACTELNFCLQAPVERSGRERAFLQLGSVYVVNRAKGPYWVRRTGATHVISVLFRPSGMRHFTPFPMGLAVDQAVPGVEIFGKPVLSLLESLKGKLPARQWVIALNQFLTKQLKAHGGSQGVFDDALRCVLVGNGFTNELDIEKRFIIDVAHFDRFLASSIGASTVDLAALARFRAAVRYLRRVPDEPLGRLALRFAYADQAHLCRDFQRFAGIAPKLLKAGPHPLNDRLLDIAPDRQ